MKAPVGVRPADKVLQALATLAALIDSTIREVKSLDSEFQARLLQAVHDTEASLQAQTEEHVDRARQQLQEGLNTKFQNDLQAALNGIKSEFEKERERFSKELVKANETASTLESERSELAAQVQQVKNDSAAEIEKARAEIQSAVHKTEVLLQENNDLKDKFQKDLQSSIDGLKSEFEREREKARESTVKAVSDTESVLKAKTAEHVEQTRQQVQAELKDKFQKELQATIDGLKSEFEKEREKAVKAVTDTEVKLKAETAEQLEHARLEVQEQLKVRHQKDLQSAVDALKAEFELERGRFNEVASNLEAERAGLITQIEQVKTDTAAEIEKARQDAKTAAARQTAATPSAPPASLQKEIEGAEAKLQEIMKLIDNPATELSTVIRKNVERSEVEAYLRGIRLVLNAKS